MYVDKKTFAQIVKQIPKRDINIVGIHTIGDPVEVIVFSVMVNGKEYYRLIAPIRIIRVPRLEAPITQLMKKEYEESIFKRIAFQLNRLFNHRHKDVSEY